MFTCLSPVLLNDCILQDVSIAVADENPRKLMRLLAQQESQGYIDIVSSVPCEEPPSNSNHRSFIHPDSYSMEMNAEVCHCHPMYARIVWPNGLYIWKEDGSGSKLIQPGCKYRLNLFGESAMSVKTIYQLVKRQDSTSTHIYYYLPAEDIYQEEKENNIDEDEEESCNVLVASRIWMNICWFYSKQQVIERLHLDSSFECTEKWIQSNHFDVQPFMEVLDWLIQEDSINSHLLLDAEKNQLIDQTKETSIRHKRRRIVEEETEDEEEIEVEEEEEVEKDIEVTFKDREQHTSKMEMYQSFLNSDHLFFSRSSFFQRYVFPRMYSLLDRNNRGPYIWAFFLRHGNSMSIEYTCPPFAGRSSCYVCGLSRDLSCQIRISQSTHLIGRDCARALQAARTLTLFLDCERERYRTEYATKIQSLLRKEQLTYMEIENMYKKDIWTNEQWQQSLTSTEKRIEQSLDDTHQGRFY